jgi:hypothetical protein
MTMRKCWMLALVFAVPLTAVAQKKPKPMPMPPATSHGLPISNYACSFNQSMSGANGVDYWSVMVFAEYGPKHKRYWTKSLGTFAGGESVATHGSESAASGAPNGLVLDKANYGEAGKKCTEWEEAVREGGQSNSK